MTYIISKGINFDNRVISRGLWGSYIALPTSLCWPLLGCYFGGSAVRDSSSGEGGGPGGQGGAARSLCGQAEVGIGGAKISAKTSQKHDKRVC